MKNILSTKHICIILTIVVALSLFSGCGLKNSLKSNIVSIKTPDSRIGTALLLGNSMVYVPSNLIDSSDDLSGNTYVIIDEEGISRPARLISNNTYTNTALLEFTDTPEEQTYDGNISYSASQPEAQDVLHVAGYTDDGAFVEGDVTVERIISQDNVDTLILDTSSLGDVQIPGGVLTDEDGNISGSVMLNVPGENKAIAIAADSLKASVEELSDSEEISIATGSSRDNIFMQLASQEFNMTNETLTTIFDGAAWIEAEVTTANILFSVAQKSGNLIRVYYKCMDESPDFSYAIGNTGSSPVSAFCGDMEYSCDITRMNIRGGDSGVILLYFEDMDTSKLNSQGIDRIEIKQAGNDSSETIVLDFKASPAAIVEEPTPEEASEGSEPGLSDEVKTAYLDILLERETEIRAVSSLGITPDYSVSIGPEFQNRQVAFEDITGDNIPDMFFLDYKPGVSSHPKFDELSLWAFSYSDGEIKKLIAPGDSSSELLPDQPYSHYSGQYLLLFQIEGSDHYYMATFARFNGLSPASLKEFNVVSGEYQELNLWGWDQHHSVLGSDEYEEVAPQIFNSISKVIIGFNWLGNDFISPDSIFDFIAANSTTSLSELNYIGMSYDEAIAYLSN